MSRPAVSPPEASALDLLRRGTIEVEGRLVTASNATLYASISVGDLRGHCVYKPVAGERPLWDFPDGTLGHREVAAYELSAATGWDVVPPTVWRDGPFGPGSVQLWVDEVAEPALVDVVPLDEVPDGALPVLQAEDSAGDPVLLVHADDERLQRMAVLDAVINNADRKAGHVLLTESGRVHGVDHGVCFNVDDKLRTVLWGWSGQPLPVWSVDVLGCLAEGLRSTGTSSLGSRLRRHLSRPEVECTAERAERLLTAGRLPRPPLHGPRIPWPPF
ncbi:MAG TPA: SCO1664 family protein [Actinomycetales bacterium]|nr:SCO1664 family protein [Actinomycetales bacterium]